MQALSGVVVLDLTHMLSGPYGTMILADLGARTIKIEPTGKGEGTRTLLADSPEFSRQGMGAYFLTLNRGKESVAVDLKSEQGKAVFFDLVRQADIVFDNFSVGVTQRLGIDYQSLAAINPRIITCSVTGFGQTGPDNQRPAFDQVVQAMGGGMSITGGTAAGPLRSGIPIGDLGGGLFGVIGVLAALQARHSTGIGQHVDISMLDAQISLLNYMATMYFLSDQVPERMGNGHFVHVPYNTYPTRDGYVIVACIGDAFFQRFLNVLPDPRLRKPEYVGQRARYADKDVIDAIIAEAFIEQSTEYWLAALRAERIPCGPVNDFAQALTDVQVRARDMVVEVTLQNGETVSMPGNPVKLSAAKDMAYTAPPTLGAHTQSVLQDLLGYEKAQIDRLREQGVVQ